LVPCSTAERYLVIPPVDTVARRVLISASTHRHLLERREISSKLDADLVAYRLTEALSNLKYEHVPRRDPRVVDLVGFVPSASRHILIPLKLVSGAAAIAKGDEWWVRTAFPFGK
jgi:hypothetical protein